ncbi:hypothetical protein BDA99DRAFT_542147 [Phascolomyces articulosus]|uniref:F-box domain-containing protein n=1 Tax=Phascolomyces articulosus TaxID=60185 RepID=A0AAD5JQ79_9FUNG|nr:hypothetical protein BDA99DRAFT_542147 [Phascolomyces articulosus]
MSKRPLADSSNTEPRKRPAACDDKYFIDANTTTTPERSFQQPSQKIVVFSSLPPELFKKIIQSMEKCLLNCDTLWKSLVLRDVKTIEHHVLLDVAHSVRSLSVDTRTNTTIPMCMKHCNFQLLTKLNYTMSAANIKEKSEIAQHATLNLRDRFWSQRAKIKSDNYNGLVFLATSTSSLTNRIIETMSNSNHSLKTVYLNFNTNDDHDDISVAQVFTELPQMESLQDVKVMAYA